MQNNSQYIAALIKKQWIRDEYVATDLITLDVLDEDFVGGYKPMILTMESLRDIIIDEISFLSMPDTPDTYEMWGGYIPMVNATENALEFVLYIDEFIELTDTPLDYTGAAGYSVVVNPTEDGLIFQAPVPQEEHYEARIQFVGVGNPTVNQLLASDLGVTVTWTQTATGVFQANFSSPVDDTKLTAYIGNSSSGSFAIGTFSPNFIQFIHRDFAGVQSDPTSIIPVEIKLYP